MWVDDQMEFSLPTILSPILWSLCMNDRLNNLWQFLMGNT